MHHITIALHTELLNRVKCSCDTHTKYFTGKTEAERYVTRHTKDIFPTIIERTLNGEILIPSPNSARPKRAKGTGMYRVIE